MSIDKDKLSDLFGKVLGTVEKFPLREMWDTASPEAKQGLIDSGLGYLETKVKEATKPSEPEVVEATFEDDDA